MFSYFFDLQRDGGDVMRDHRGFELCNLDAARVQALRVWTGILLARASGGPDPQGWQITIRDVQGTELAKVPYPSELDCSDSD